MLSLPDITLFAISAANFALTQRAISISQGFCDFGDTLFMTNQAHADARYRTEVIPSFATPAETADFAFTQIAKHIHTPFILSIQWDGYVVNPDAWTNDFLQYDYIGAKWPWHTDGRTVGNGGFCLRSRKLMQLLAELVSSGEIKLPGTRPEDDYVCRELRPKLESLGIRFAPEAVADRFSYERAKPMQTTFGFHGPFNMWRHIDYSELSSIIEAMDDYVVQGKHYDELAHAYKNLGRFDLVDLMGRRRAKVYG